MANRRKIQVEFTIDESVLTSDLNTELARFYAAFWYMKVAGSGFRMSFSGRDVSNEVSDRFRELQRRGEL